MNASRRQTGRTGWDMRPAPQGWASLPKTSPQSLTCALMSLACPPITETPQGLLYRWGLVARILCVCVCVWCPKPGLHLQLKGEKEGLFVQWEAIWCHVPQAAYVPRYTSSFDWCLCVYVCLCICVFVSVYLSAYLCQCVCLWMPLCPFVSESAFVWMSLCVCLWLCLCLCGWVHLSECLCLFVSVHVSSILEP